MRGSRLLRVVETAERLPPPLQPVFWGALLGVAVTAGLILASVPLWLFQGRADIPAAVLDMGLAGVWPGAAGGALALVFGGLRRAGPGGYYALWVASNAGAALIFLALLRLMGRGEVLGLDRTFAPLIVAGLGALNGLIVGRALGRSGRESYGEFRSAANLVAGALLAETADLERRARADKRAANDLEQVRQAVAEQRLSRVARSGCPGGSRRCPRAIPTRPRAGPRGRADDARAGRHAAARGGPGFAEELRHRQEVAEELFRKELEREAKRLRKSGDTGPATQKTLGAIERELRGGSGKES